MKMTARDRLLLYSIVDSTGCWLWQGTKFKTGYGQITYEKKALTTHRLSAHLFKNFDLASKLLILHKCDVKNCVNPGHLYIGTHADNAKDAVDRYRLRRGSRHPNSKLNEQKVSEIWKLIREGMKLRAIAKIYDVDCSTIGLIKRRQIWTHIKETT